MARLAILSRTIFLLSPHRHRWTPSARTPPCNGAGSLDASAACTAQVPLAPAHGIPLFRNSSGISSADDSISPFSRPMRFEVVLIHVLVTDALELQCPRRYQTT